MTLEHDNYLTSLPLPIKEQLVQVVRTAAGMSDEEKEAGHAILTGFAHFAQTNGYAPSEISVLLMIARIGVVLEHVSSLAGFPLTDLEIEVAHD